MRSHLLAACALALPLSLSVSPASAQIRPGSVEGSVYGGVWEGGARFDTAPTFGARVGYNLHHIFGIEATYGFVPTTQHPLTIFADNEPPRDQLLGLFGTNVMLHLSYDAFVPYVSAGVGFVHADEVDFAGNVALGAKYYFNDFIGLRADLRSWLSEDAPSTDQFAHFEATLGLTVQIGGDYDIDDDGIPNDEDACPGDAEDKDGFEDTDGCPDLDNDEDGVVDADDRCPDAAEDRDGDADDDGCPDVDSDGDGIGDRDDKCPQEPEDADGFQDADGCPDPDNDQDGLADGADNCPTEAEDKDGFEDGDGCPDLDNDQDGVLDTADGCPDAAEDKDGFKDEDGCPDLDNDLDGVLDAVDECPDEKETINGNKDDDGCPDEGESLVSVTVTRIEIKQKIFFDTAKATIKTRSHNLLNQVALILKANQQIKKVSIEGHTDDRGKDAYNLDLSDARAKAVRAYLVEVGGITADRLEAKGFGESKPIADNRSAAGREKNRRVEFTIIDPKPIGDEPVPEGAKVTPAKKTVVGTEGELAPKPATKDTVEPAAGQDAAQPDAPAAPDAPKPADGAGGQ